VSPDGASVYVVSDADDAIVRFTRNTVTGALTDAGCKEDQLMSNCGPGNVVHGLADANDVAVSPDGASVYVASRGDMALVHFARSTTGDIGALSDQGCFNDPAGESVGNGCGAGRQQAGLIDAYALAVSPDGTSVYIAARGAGALVRFARTPGTGALSALGCIADVGGTDCGGGNSHEGLAGAEGVAVSPDSRSVYVASGNDDAVTRFDRDPLSGGLTGRGCIADAGSAASCSESQPGLDKAYGLAVSPDGASVYALGASDHAVVHFGRDAAGALTGRGCVGPTANGCTVGATGLSVPYGIAVSPDGTSVYVTSWGNGAIVRLFRETTAGSSPPSTPSAGGAPPTVPTAPRAPSSEFTFTDPFALPRNGTVTFSVDLPGAGTILVHATGRVFGPPQVRRASAGARPRRITIARKRLLVRRAGRVKVVLRPTKTAMRYLRDRRRLKASVKITFTATGGMPSSATRTVTFRLAPRRR
jgi:DNA-binding beta-propeller fold protein YncE